MDENKEFSIIKDEVRELLNKAKGRVCNEFEKVCPTETSLKRVIKDMHDIFDALERALMDIALKKGASKQ